MTVPQTHFILSMYWTISLCDPAVEEFTSVCIIIESFVNILFFAGWPIKQIAFDLRWQWKWQGQERRAWPFFFCLPSYISGLHRSSSSTFPAISLGFTVLLLLPSQLYLWASPFFFFCLPSYISGLHRSSSSSAFPAISLGFTVLLLLLPSQLYLWASPFSFFFFFCLPSYISGLHRSSSSSAFPAISLGFTVLLLLLPSQLYLWASPFFFFFCLPSYISGLHCSSSSAFPAISLGFTVLLLLPSQLYLWASPFFFFFFFCLPSYISGLHRSSSSSAFPAILLGFTILLILLLLLPSQLYLWASPFFFLCLPQLYFCSSPFFFLCVPIYISAVHHSSSCVFPAISLGFTILLHVRSQLLVLLQRSTAVQVRSSVRLMPQKQPSGRGLLPSPTAWSSDQHPVAMLADVSWHALGRTEGCGLGFGQLVRTHTGKCLKCQSSSDGHSDHNALCAGGR